MASTAGRRRKKSDLSKKGKGKGCMLEMGAVR